MINGEKNETNLGIAIEENKPLAFNLIWCEETDRILLDNWDAADPPKIAALINLWITRYGAGDPKRRNKTSAYGGGVITRARVLNMISADEFRRLYEKYVVPNVE